MHKVVLSSMLLLSLSFLAPDAAEAAKLDGRVSTYNLTSAFQYNDATDTSASSLANVLLLRTYLNITEIGGGNTRFHLDARSEFGIVNAKGAFNEYCQGQIGQNADCEQQLHRHSVLGDLDRIAGIYDAYFAFGGGRPGKFGFAIGRKTIYEAGALTVDGVDLHRVTESGKWGAFGGIQPNPDTGIPDPQYAAAGGYWGFQNNRMLLRVAAAAQLFGFKPDLVYLYTQDFFRLAKGLTLSTIIQFDMVPLVSDRLTLIDLTYRTGPRWRLRLSFHRHRSQAYGARPLLEEQLKLAPGDYSPALEIPGTKSFAEASTYHSLRLIGQVETVLDIHAFATAGFRQRTIDGAFAPVFSLGATTYHPIKLPVQGTVRYKFKGGFDSVDHSLGVHLHRKLNFLSPVSFGGGIDFLLSSHKSVDPTINPNVSDTSNLFVFSGWFRYDIAKYAVYASYEGARPSATTEADEETSLEHLLILGVTMRFGQGAKRLF